MKNFTVPVGGPPAGVPVTTAWSVTDWPRVISAEDGVVLIPGGSLLTVRHSLASASIDGSYALPAAGTYSPRQHQVPTEVGWNDPESSCEEFVFGIGTSVSPSAGVPTCVPPLEQTPFVSSAGLQMKNFTVPAGGPPSALPSTWAWSVTDWPRSIEAEDGVVLICDCSRMTVRHSLESESLTASYGLPAAGTYSPRQHHLPVAFGVNASDVSLAEPGDT